MKSVFKPKLKDTAFEVLLVEDNLAVAEQLRELLLEAKDVRVPVTRVKHISEAIEALKQENFDVILLDLSLLDGKELDTISTFKEYACKGKTDTCPPIVVLSEIDDEDLALQAIQAGAQDYLVKGKIERGVLIRSLRYAIARRDAIGTVGRGATSIASISCQQMQEALQSSEQDYHCVIDDNLQEVSFQTALKQAEEALQQSEARLQRLVENVPGVIYQYLQYPDGTDKFTYVSPGVRDLCELEPEAIYENSQLAWASIHPDDLSAFIASVDHSAKTLGQWRMEWRIITRSGAVKWLQGVARPEKQPDGTLIWDGILLEISDKKQVEKALKENEEKFRQMAQCIHECFWMSDAEMTQVLYISPAYEEIYGRSCQSAYERIDSWLEAVHPEDRQRLINFWDHLLQGETVEAEYRVIRPDGSIVWVLDRTFPVRNEKGEIYRVAGIALDISERKRTQEALKESEAKFRQLAEHIHQVFWMVSTNDDKILYVSPAYEKIWQRSCQSVYEKPSSWLEAIHPEDRERMMVAFQHVPDGNYKEYRIVRPDGSIRWIGSHAFPIQNEQGEVYRVAGIDEDITERKQAEEALRQSAATNRALLNGTPDMMFRCRADGTFVDFKPAKDMKTLVPPSVFIGKKVQEILPPPLPQRVMQAYEQALLSDKTQIVEYQLPSDGELHDYEARIVAKDRDEFIAIVRDITERKRTESALRQQKELLQTIFDHIPVMVAFLDATGQIQLMNRELERVLGWSLADLGDCDLLAFCYPNPKYRQRVVKQMLAATGKWQDFKTRTRDGRVLDTSWANIRLKDGTRIGIGQDITERKCAEEALRSLTQKERAKALQLEQTLKQLQHTQAQLIQNEKMASLGQLVAGVAHEINNPVSFISCNVAPATEYTTNLLDLISLYQQHYPTPSAEIQDEIETINLDFIKEDFPKLLCSMQEGAFRIQKIVQSLRNFSRLDEAERKKADLHEGLDSTLVILQTRLKQQPNRVGIQVIKEYGDLPLVECYPSELNQVFMNILSNAIDALEERMKENSLLIPQIRIYTDVSRGNGQPSTDKIVVRIADNGCGLPLKVKQRVFDPFFTTKPIGKGTGLGLSISHAIVVEKHHGELHCNSQLGQGTEFAIELPLLFYDK
ncbi:MAG TPA: PAS domain S-box protein [Coleofasciculaceae cyanobacterium]|jgi:PAS domain S-box-containing protein